jgi:hypothetical protein
MIDMYESGLPDEVRLDKVVTVGFRECEPVWGLDHYIPMLQWYYAKSGEQLGDPLTDQSYRTDNPYRYHDMLHWGFYATMGWSPVLRTLMGKQRLFKHGFAGGDVEDRGKARIIEEAVMYEIWNKMDFESKTHRVTSQDIATYKAITSEYEIKDQPVEAWFAAINLGVEATFSAISFGEAEFTADMNKKTITFHLG